MSVYPVLRRTRLFLAVIALTAASTACQSGAVDESPDAEDAEDADGDEDGAASDGDECIPYEDDCAEGEYCQFEGGRTQCVPEGDVLRDEPCEEGLCQRGSICMFADSIYGKHCQQPCNLAEDFPCDVGRHTCFVAVDDAGQELSFGVCRY